MPPYDQPQTTTGSPRRSTTSCTATVSAKSDPRCSSTTSTRRPRPRSPAATRSQTAPVRHLPCTRTTLTPPRYCTCRLLSVGSQGTHLAPESPPLLLTRRCNHSRFQTSASLRFGATKSGNRCMQAGGLRPQPSPSQTTHSAGPEPHGQRKSPGLAGLSQERMKRLEPSTFCMASRPDRGDYRRRSTTNASNHAGSGSIRRP